MFRLVIRLIGICCCVFIVACSSDPELASDDPANCKQMNEFPDMYDECMEELSR